MNVPFLDLKSLHESIKPEIDEAIADVINSSAFSGGQFVERFEKEFADYCGSLYSTACGSGTDALVLALKAAGIGPGDEVITVPNTFIATVEAIFLSGAKPVLVDVKESDFTINTKLINSALTERTKAIIPVHLYGQLCDMDTLMEIAEQNGLIVIEDACQAHGAEYKGKRAGSIGHLGCFSFYPGKNLGAFGEAGAVVTDSEEYYQNMRMLRDHGQSRKYFHDIPGWNSRMDGLQGAVLSTKLKHLDKWNKHRRLLADIYDRELAGLKKICFPERSDENICNFHIYPILTEDRDETLIKMRDRGISCAIHYPVPIHRQQAFADLFDKGISFPVAEKNAREELSLPMSPTMTEEHLFHTVNTLKTLF